MSEKVHAECDDCGKSYRVPSAERTYDCKACGGEVVPDGFEDEVEEDEVPEEPRKKRLSETHRGAKDGGGLRIALMVAVLLLVVGGGGYAIWKSSNPTFAAEGETDLEAVTALFVADWNEGEVAELVKYHHPDGRPNFQWVLESAGDRRGWDTPLPPITGHRATILPRKTDEPLLGLAALECGEWPIALRWQFSDASQRWFLYAYEIRPGELAPRVEAFEADFAESDLAALELYFRAETASQHLDLFRKVADKLGWTDAHPTLGPANISGEEAARAPGASSLLTPKVEAVHAVPEGELTVRWRFYPADDEWFVTAWKLPK